MPIVEKIDMSTVAAVYKTEVVLRVLGDEPVAPTRRPPGPWTICQFTTYKNNFRKARYIVIRDVVDDGEHRMEYLRKPNGELREFPTRRKAQRAIDKHIGPAL